MKFKKIKKQKGFTMIELVIVIAILGILAAFALPRFANFTSNAQNAAAQNVAGTLNTSLGIVKARYISNGSTGGMIDLDGDASTGIDRVHVKSNGDLNMIYYSNTDTCEILVNALLTNRNGLDVYSETDGICTLQGRDFSVNLTETGATVN